MRRRRDSMLLATWREVPCFDDRERAALALAEAIALIHDGQVPDDVYDEAASRFDDAELTALIWTCVTIDGWNRVATAGRAVPPLRGGGGRMRRPVAAT